MLDRIYPASVGERLPGTRQHILHQSHEDVAVADGRRPPRPRPRYSVWIATSALVPVAFNSPPFIRRPSATYNKGA